MAGTILYTKCHTITKSSANPDLCTQYYNHPIQYTEGFMLIYQLPRGVDWTGLSSPHHNLSDDVFTLADDDDTAPAEVVGDPIGGWFIVFVCVIYLS